MQILKDKIRYQILTESQHLFLQQGYEKTTMSQIAAKVSISKSNMYHYYDSKQAIFDALTESAALELRRMLVEYRQRASRLEERGRGAQMLMSNQVSNLMIEQKYGLLMLMQAGGTRYEALMDSLIEIFTARIATEIRDADNREIIARIAAQNIVQGMICILRYCVRPEDIRAAIEKLVLYHCEGMYALMR